MKSIPLGRGSGAVLALLMLCFGVGSAHAATFDVIAIPNGPGATGVWNITLGMTDPSDWTFSIRANGTSVPNGNVSQVEFGIDGVDIGPPFGVCCAFPPVSAGGVTDAPWISSLGNTFFDLQSGAAQLLLANGSNVMTGAYSLGPPVPLAGGTSADVHFIRIEPFLNGPFGRWLGRAIIELTPAAAVPLPGTGWLLGGGLLTLLALGRRWR